MAPRNERKRQQVRTEAKERTSTVISVSALVALVLCAGLDVLFAVKYPNAKNAPVPDVVFWILAAVLAPDLVKLIRGGR